ncbi:MAG: phosphoserine phosphatase SerB [Pseudomonadota bacterium]
MPHHAQDLRELVSSINAQHLKETVRAIYFSAQEQSLSFNQQALSLPSNATANWRIALIGKTLQVDHLLNVLTLLEARNLDIDFIGLQELSQLDGIKTQCWAICLADRTPPDPALVDSIRSLELADTDVACLPPRKPESNIKLACFDMDSTLIETEVINELADAAGVGQQVAEITERAMQGELDFKASLNQRVAQLKDLSADVMAEIAIKLPVMPGASTLTNSLAKMNIDSTILSGGFDYFAEHLASKIGINHYFANKLEIKNNQLTGKVLPPIMDAEAKRDHLLELADARGLSPSQVLAVGDGANDLLMLNAAGIGVAYKAKPIVSAAARYSISENDLSAVLYLL